MEITEIIYLTVVFLIFLILIIEIIITDIKNKEHDRKRDIQIKKLITEYVQSKGGKLFDYGGSFGLLEYVHIIKNGKIIEYPILVDNHEFPTKIYDYIAQPL